MTIRARFLLIAVPALVAAGVLFPGGLRAGRPYDASINNERALMFKGRVVSVDPAGLSVSVRGDEGFRTFETRPNMVKGAASGDTVAISYLKNASGLKAMSLSVTERARGATETETIRAQREERRKQEATQKAAKSSRNLQPSDTVNDGLGYGRGYYRPASER
jgi:hypothetical protein